MLNSNFQEHALAIEEIEEEPADGDVGNLSEERLRVLGHQFDKAVEKSFRGVGKVNEPLSQIDCDGVHANDCKEECPLAPITYIYYIIEEGSIYRAGSETPTYIIIGKDICSAADGSPVYRIVSDALYAPGARAPQFVIKTSISVQGTL